MHLIKALIILTFCTSFAYAQNCEPAMSLESFNSLVIETHQKYFPELEKTKIKVTTFKSDAYFLQAQPDKKTLFKKSQNRVYEVQLNVRLLACPPDINSLQGIIVHELEHVKDYEGWSTGKIAAHTIKFLTDRNFRARYERKTDLKAMQKGLSEGIKGYRFWIYQWLTPKQLKIKKRYYYTPEEISVWQEHNHQDME